MNWLYYLLEANLYLSIFYAAYLLLLRNETFYSTNRWYLLITSTLAFVLPVMQIGWLKPVEAITQVMIISNQTAAPVGTINKINVAPALTYIDWANITMMIYALGIGLTIILFTVKLAKLYRLIGKSPKTSFEQYKLIEVDEQNTGFSFFSYLFIGKNLTDRHTIMTHEMVHIRQKHSADIIFMEVLKIVNWFNPLVYLLQNSLKTVHEYIADEHTATTETDNLTYSSFLLNNAYGLQGPAASNSFFNYNLLKNRIIMLNKPRSGSAARLKYLMIMPLTATMLSVSTLTFSKEYGYVDLLPNALPVTENMSASTPTIAQQPETKTPTKVDSNQKTKIVRFPPPKVETYKKPTAKPGVVKIPPPKIETYKIPAGKPGVVKFPPPKVELAAVNKTKNAPISDNDNSKHNKVQESDFQPFYAYIAKHVRYPAAELRNKVTGRTLLQLALNADNTIKDVKIFRSPNEALSKEIARAILTYKNPLPAKPNADYIIPVSYQIMMPDDSIFFEPSGPKDASNADDRETVYIMEESNKPSYSLNEVVIIGYLPKN